MKKRRTYTLILTLAVASCFALASEGQAQLDDPLTQRQAQNNLRNARKATPIPTWQITQPGTAFSVPWVDHAPNPRFAVYDPNGNSTDNPDTWFDDIVLDKETGLVWERRPGSLPPAEAFWDDAVGICYQRRLADRRGWRVPNAVEFLSLVDEEESPALPAGHPFSLSAGTEGDFYYWSSTTTPNSGLGGDVPGALMLIFQSGIVYTAPRSASLGVWCVRGGVGLIDHFAP